MITIDKEKCIGCMKCVWVCPFMVLSGDGDKPQISREKYCIKCLHCAAACPQNAISLDGMDGIISDDVFQLSDQFQTQLEQYLLSRRSYRRFKPEPVPKEIISKALTVAAWAPSAKNQHPTKWIVISGKSKIKEIMDAILEYVKETGVSPEIADLYEQGHNVVTGMAETLILGYARAGAINPPVDTALAIYHAELMLQTQGIGTCWGGYLTRMCNQVSALRELFHLPEGYQFYGSIMVGYPENEEYIHIPNRHKQPDIQWMK